MKVANVVGLTVLCLALFFMGEITSYKTACKQAGVFGAGEGDQCYCQYYYCVFYNAYNVWIKYPYNCSNTQMPGTNYTFDNVTMKCGLNITTTTQSSG